MKDRSRMRRRLPIHPGPESLEQRLCLAVIRFTGTEIVVDAAADVANQLMISLAGDTYTFHDASDKITDVIDKPVDCQVNGITGDTTNNPVTIECPADLIELITLNMGDQNDIVILESARDAVRIFGGDHDDRFVVTRPNQLTGHLTVDGGGGTNSLQLDDSAETLATRISISANTVGTGQTDNFFGPGGGLVSYSQLSDLTVTLGSGDDTATIASTHPGATLVAFGLGQDVLVVNDEQEVIAHDYEISNVVLTRDSAVLVSYNDVETLDLRTGSADDSVIVDAFGSGLPATIRVTTGGGDDSFDVNLGTPSVGVVLQLDADAGIDSLVVSAGNSIDAIAIDDHGQIVAGATTIALLRIEGISLSGGDGADRIDVSKSTVGITVFAGAGDDEVISGSADDIIFGDAGNDMINAGEGNDAINTGDGNDIIFGGGGNDMINAGEGNDAINTGDGNDIIFGGSGNDTVNSGSGDDQVNTGDGNDIIFGGGGNDMVNGGSGNDQVNTGDGNDIIFGGGGNDMVNGGSGNDQINTGDGNDIIFGGDGNDSMSGGIGDDILFGGSSDDVLNGGGGDDVYVFGGDDLGSDQIVEAPNVDTDVLDFSGLAGPVTVDLASLAFQSVSPGILNLTFIDPVDPTAPEFTGIENVVGTAFADEVLGNSHDNLLVGADLFEFNPTDPPTDVTETQWVLLDFDSHTGAGEWIYTATERDAVEQRLEADYAHFNFSFTQQVAEIPTASFATLFFNKLGSLNQPGQADELDFRNLNLGGTAAIDVNIILGGLGQPELNSDNVVAASASIAAHELGHLVGLRHADSFGPIGFGIHNPPGGDKFVPHHAGVANAFETVGHLMASPASVGSSLTDAVDDPFFSERSAIKLAFAESGAVADEMAGDHAEPATAQSIALSGLYVPNSLLAGINVGKQFAVEAVDVLGSIELQAPGGVSESDVYEFTAQAGDIFTFEVMSVALDRIAAPVDPVLRILDSAGNVLGFFDGFAENDDSFEPPDSLLVDFPISSAGSYFLEVDTFTFAGDPDFETFCGPGGEFEGSDACSDTDTGQYELFVYRFDAGHKNDLGDVLVGRDGNDTLRGGIGDDTLDGGAADDVMEGDQGDDTMVIVPGSTDLIIELPGVSGGIDLLDFSKAFSGISIDLSIDDGTPQVVDSAANLVAIEGVVENVIGSLFADSIIGNAQNNVLDGLAGDDSLFAAAGDDTLTGGSGVDTLDGGTGTDTVFEVRDADMTLRDASLKIGTEGTDSLAHIELARLTGGAGNNTINASRFRGNTTLLGLGGNDNLSAGIGNDRLDGGDGNDQLAGGNGSDILLGGAGGDHVVGGAGRDLIMGGLGNDRLVGGADDDILIGGTTIYDTLDLALQEILTEWNSMAGYPARVVSLRMGIAAPPELPVGVLKLDATTVIDDGVVDELTGSADRDWFLVFFSGDITDKKPNEEVD
jgi:Ca2+-binding RTX toxin-like protein